MWYWIPFLAASYVYISSRDIHTKMSAADAVEVLREGRGGKDAHNTVRESAQKKSTSPQRFREEVTKERRSYYTQLKDNAADYIKAMEAQILDTVPAHVTVPDWQQR